MERKHSTGSTDKMLQKIAVEVICYSLHKGWKLKFCINAALPGCIFVSLTKP